MIKKHTLEKTELMLGHAFNPSLAWLTGWLTQIYILFKNYFKWFHVFLHFCAAWKVIALQSRKLSRGLWWINLCRTIIVYFASFRFSFPQLPLELNDLVQPHIWSFRNTAAAVNPPRLRLPSARCGSNPAQMPQINNLWASVCKQSVRILLNDHNASAYEKSAFLNPTYFCFTVDFRVVSGSIYGICVRTTRIAQTLPEYPTA